MSLFQHRSERVERYFDALHCDPHTVPPQDLDHDTAALIQAIVSIHASPGTQAADGTALIPNQESARSEQRVWDRVMFAILAPPELAPTYISEPTVTSGQETSNLPSREVRSAKVQSPDVPTIFASISAYVPVMPARPVGYRRQKPDLSFVAAMLIAVFCFTGLLLRQDALSDDPLRRPPPLKTQMTSPAFDTSAFDENPALLVRYQPSEIPWARLPIKSRVKEGEVRALSSLNRPIMVSEHYPQ